MLRHKAASAPWSSTGVGPGASGRGAHPIWCILRNGLGASLPQSDDPLDWYAGAG
jgi:hypothetical protein